MCWRTVGRAPIEVVKRSTRTSLPARETAGIDVKKNGRRQKNKQKKQVVGNGILPQLVYSLSEKNRFYKKAAAFVDFCHN